MGLCLFVRDCLQLGLSVNWEIVFLFNRSVIPGKNTFSRVWCRWPVKPSFKNLNLRSESYVALFARETLYGLEKERHEFLLKENSGRHG